MCFSKLSLLIFLVLLYPLSCAVAALLIGLGLLPTKVPKSIPKAFAEELLEPQHWFALWRLNCTLVAYHAWLTGSTSYRHEDKGFFLLEGEVAGVPVSPFLKVDRLVIKSKSIEGGMGIHFFKNFTEGGDWIIQRHLQNSEFIVGLLPPSAPLSTLRVITASRLWLLDDDDSLYAPQGAPNGAGSECGDGALSSTAAANGHSAAMDSGSSAEPDRPDVEVLTVVFRAGRATASTDHDSILFNVDQRDGTIGMGVSNQHWYKLGWRHVLRVGSTRGQQWTRHPDTGVQITGACIPGLTNILGLCMRAHRKLLPDVPLVGWDVALTTEGVFLLELNISCNFFQGTYDRDGYVQLMLLFFTALDQLRLSKAEKRS